MNKVKVQFEFPMHASPSLIFQYIGTTTGLSEWFADEVIEKNDVFYFNWSGEVEEALLVRYKEGSYVRFKWKEDINTKYFFEMLILEDEITNDVALQITDFCLPGEEEDTYHFWDNAISNLKHIIGN